MNLEVIILAAGQGTRMKSRLPKVLHPVAGRPMLEHVVTTALSLGPRAVHVVVGHGSEQVQAQLSDYKLNWVLQDQQKGTIKKQSPNILKCLAIILIIKNCIY